MYTEGSTTEWQAAKALLELDRRAHQCWANFSEGRENVGVQNLLNHFTIWIDILIRYHTELEWPEVFR